MQTDTSSNTGSSFEVSKSRLLNASNTRLGRALFIEFDNIYDTRLAVYSLSREDKVVDGVTYPSLYKLYLATEDITEAEFVNLYMYDLKQWEQLCEAPFFREEIAQWRKELRLYKLSQMVATLEEDVARDTKTATSSAKFLIEKVYNTSGKAAGRPANKGRAEKEDSSLFSSTTEELRRVLNDGAA